MSDGVHPLTLFQSNKLMFMFSLSFSIFVLSYRRPISVSKRCQRKGRKTWRMLRRRGGLALRLSVPHYALVLSAPPLAACLPAPSSCDERQSMLHHHLRKRWHEMEEGKRAGRHTITLLHFIFSLSPSPSSTRTHTV